MNILQQTGLQRPALLDLAEADGEVEAVAQAEAAGVVHLLARVASPNVVAIVVAAEAVTRSIPHRVFRLLTSGPRTCVKSFQMYPLQ